MQKIEQLWIFPENLSRKKNLHCWYFCITYSAFTTNSWFQEMGSALWMRWDVECGLAECLAAPLSLGRQRRWKGEFRQGFLGHHWISDVCNPACDTQRVRGQGGSAQRVQSQQDSSRCCLPAAQPQHTPKTLSPDPRGSTQAGHGQGGLAALLDLQVLFSFKQSEV